MENLGRQYNIYIYIYVLISHNTYTYVCAQSILLYWRIQTGTLTTSPRDIQHYTLCTRTLARESESPPADGTPDNPFLCFFFFFCRFLRRRWRLAIVFPATTGIRCPQPAEGADRRRLARANNTGPSSLSSSSSILYYCRADTLWFRVKWKN